MLVTDKNKVDHGVCKLCNFYSYRNLQLGPELCFTFKFLCHLCTHHVCLDPEQPEFGHGSYDPESTIILDICAISQSQAQSMYIFLILYFARVYYWILDTKLDHLTPSQNKSPYIYFFHWLFNYNLSIMNCILIFTNSCVAGPITYAWYERQKQYI